MTHDNWAEFRDIDPVYDYPGAEDPTADWPVPLTVTPAAEALLDVEEIDIEPPATAADWLEATPEDRHPDGFEPRADPPAVVQLWERQGRTTDTTEIHLDQVGFPDDFKGAGPMHAAVPLGAHWYNLAARGVTTYIPESGDPGTPEPVCAFLDRDQAEEVADATTHGELTWNQGLVGWNDVTAARAQAERQAEDAAWGGRNPSASYAEWLAEGRREADRQVRAACPHPPGVCPFEVEPEAGS